MAHRLHTVATLVLCAWVNIHVCAQELSPVPEPIVPAAITAEQVEVWVKNLNSNVFTERELATTHLEQAGRIAVGPVAAALEGQNLEVTTRAIHVLRFLASCGDDEAEEQALTALEKARSLRNTATARRAETALVGIAEIRQTRTIDTLQRLGARFSATTTPFGLQIDDEITEVEIGSEWRGEDKDLTRLRWLSDIHKVTFSGSLVTDNWLKVIGGMENVTDLRVKRAKITDSGLAYIKELPKLARLSLRYMPISDAAVDHLVHLKSLQLLELYGTDITPEGAKKVVNALELAKIDFRRGGFLGIGGQNHLLGYQIFRVQENSAASKAGIEIEDILVKFEEDNIRTFEELTSRIAKNRAGDTVTLTIARNANPRTLEIQSATGDRLGITSKPHLLGLEVTEVTSNSVGSDSGVRVGDVIVAYKKIRLEEVAQLKELFEKNKPGETTEMEIVRGAQVERMKITLGEWD